MAEEIPSINTSLAILEEEAEEVLSPGPEEPISALAIEAMNRAALSPASGGGGRGKTMKEYEDELTELRRDNFDLRMRIYLMEENASTCPEDASVDYQPPSTFATMKDLYLTNKNLKTEVEVLKGKLAEKEAAAVRSTTELEILRKDTRQEIEKLTEVHKQETDELNERIAELTKDLKEMDDVVASWRHEMKEASMINDTTTMAALAFSMLNTTVPKVPQSSGRYPDYNDIFNLECKIAMLEKELNEERQMRVESDLAVDAARAELRELEASRSALALSQARLDEKSKALQEQLAAQEMELERARAVAGDRLRSMDDDSTRSLKEQLVMREQELATAHKIIEEKCLHVDSLEDMLKRMRMSPARKGGGDYERSGEGLSDLEKQVAALTTKLASQESEIDSLRRENVKALRTIQGFIKQNKALSRDLEELRQRKAVPEDKLAESGEVSLSKEELQRQVEILTEELDCLKKGLGDDEKSSKDAAGLIMCLRADLDVKRKEVDLLNEELRKRTFNLQELVNTELWDKNREIEKLNKTCERKQVEVGNLKKEILTMNEKLQSLTQLEGKENENPNVNTRLNEKNWEDVKSIEEENKKLKDEIETLQSRFEQQIAKCESLKNEAMKFKTESEESEKSRKELVNACTLLTTRLEELATFLESLLPSLGSRKRRMVQQAIDQSREMSRSFSFLDRTNISVPILPDVSQVEFCSGDESLRIDLKEPDGEVVHLRTQVESLVEKLKQAEGSPKEKSKPPLWTYGTEQLEDVSQCSLVDSLDSESEDEVTSRPSVAIVTKPADIPIEPPSDSDAGWSEPDLNVSKQRIGINDSIHRSHGVNNTSEESNQSSFRKSPSAGKRIRPEGMPKLRRLSTKLDSLEQVNEAFLKLHQANAKISGPPSPRVLLERVRRKKKNPNNSNEEVLKNKAFEVRLVEEIEQLSSQLERSCSLCLELEERASILEIERDEATDRAMELSSRVSSLEEGLANVEAERDEALTLLENLSTRLEEAKESLQSSAKEHENALLESQCSLLEANNQALLLQAKVDSLTDTVTDKQKVIVQLESELATAKELAKEAEERSKEFQAAVDRHAAELELRRESAEDEAKRTLELERRLAEAYDIQAEFRAKIDEEQSRLRNVEENFKVVKEYKRRIADLEAEIRDLESGRGFHQEVGNNRSAPIMLRSPPISPRSPTISPRSPMVRSPPISPRSLPASPPPGILLARQRSNPSSDYVSDQEHYYQQPGGMWSVARSNNNSSPDLGIESDQHSAIHSIERHHPALEPLPQLSHPPPTGDLGKLETENRDLRRHLLKTRKALEDTLSQLTSANQKKKQVERAICKQLHKTHHILQKARVNLETDPPS